MALITFVCVFFTNLEDFHISCIAGRSKLIKISKDYGGIHKKGSIASPIPVWFALVLITKFVYFHDLICY